MGNVEVFLHVFQGCFWGVDFPSDSASFWGSKKGDFGGQKQEKSVPFLGVHDRSVEIRVFWGSKRVILPSDSASFWCPREGDFGGQKGSKVSKNDQNRGFLSKKGDTFCPFWVSRARRDENRISRLIRLLFGVKKGSFFPFFGCQNHVFGNVDLPRHGIVTFRGLRGSIFVTFGGVKKGHFGGVKRVVFGQKRVIFGIERAFH
jgi:hypothetical protein